MLNMLFYLYRRTESPDETKAFYNNESESKHFVKPDSSWKTENWFRFGNFLFKMVNCNWHFRRFTLLWQKYILEWSKKTTFHNVCLSKNDFFSGDDENNMIAISHVRKKMWFLEPSPICTHPYISTKYPSTPLPIVYVRKK